jgi:hypothetical protein
MGKDAKRVELFYCERCACMRPHKHMHCTAYDLEQTHMAGSEHFDCTGCGKSTFANDEGASRFPFILDKVSK